MTPVEELAAWAAKAARAVERELDEVEDHDERERLHGMIIAFRRMEEKAHELSPKLSDVSPLVVALVKRYGVRTVLAELDKAAMDHCWEDAPDGWDAKVRRRLMLAAANMRGRLAALATNRLVVPFAEASEKECDGIGPFASIASTLDTLLVRASERFASRLP